jgi:hypothetical protein
MPAPVRIKILLCFVIQAFHYLALIFIASAMNVCYSLRSPKTKVLGWARDSQSESLDADNARVIFSN